MKITGLILLFFFAAAVFAQTDKQTNVLSGTVTLKESGTPVRNASVTIAELKSAVVTDDNGRYKFDHVPPGKYQVVVHLERVTDAVKVVDLTGETNSADFELTLSGISEQVTITASGSLESINNSYQSVSTLGTLRLAEKNTLSIGEALDNEPGVAKRSFGPGSGRPVIRGFDGDRVLILQDGLRIGGIASQSGDEAEPMDVLSLDRIEIVKGPATLLYGSNAIGGVVNGISANNSFQPGLSGYLTAFGGTNNWQASGGGGIKYGFRDFLLYANGGAQKANNYRTPTGTVLNSFSHLGNASGGIGWFPHKGWLAFDFTYDHRRHGIPVGPDEVDFESLNERRNGYNAKGGFRDLGVFIESGDFAVSFNDYKVREFKFESDENVTELESLATNKNFNYRASFNHRRRGKFSGTFGFSGFTRDYEAIGEEAPAPRTKQNSFAIYGLERIDLERIGFQFGGRLEQNGYDPAGGLRSRNFIGFSGGAGLRVPLWSGGSFVANYQHSFRAPALEELYNDGPHPGILVFDIGNANLNAEQGDGLDFSLRHSTDRVRLEGGAYYYNISNFVYTAFTGATNPSSNLPIIQYAQSTSRYVGTEASIETKILDTLWLKGKIDYVQAELIALNKPLPRIPPLRGSFGLDWRYKALSVRPEVILTNKQTRVFDNETPTSGYKVLNLDASYMIFSGRMAHVFSLGGYNLTNELYRNHLSFIKNIAPEIGRGIRANYSLRF